MIRSRIPTGALAAALLAATAFAALPATAAGEDTRAVTRSFPLSAATLRLANLAGAVELVPGRGSEVRVEATVHAAGDDAAETARLLAGMSWVVGKDRHGKSVWELSYPVEGYRGFAYPRAGDEIPRFFERFSSSSVRYRGRQVRIYAAPRSGVPVLYADLRIEVPAGSDLWVRDAVGKISGGGLTATLALDTGSGDVELSSHTGSLAVDTGSGDVQVSKLRGDGKIDTGSGDVRLEGGDAPKISADTGSGDVRVTEVEFEELVADTGSGDVTVRSSLAQARRLVADTGSGDVLILAGADASFDLRADVGSGDVEVRFEDARLRRDGREIVGAQRGDGRTRIVCDTGSGDCVIGPGT